MDKIQAYGSIGLAISKCNMAVTKLTDVAQLDEISVDANFYAKELVNIVNNLIILQEKLKEDLHWDWVKE